MKYNIGDKVKVRSDLVPGKKYGGVYFASNMKKYCDSFITIERVCSCFYEVKESSFVFSDEMLEESKYITKEKLEAYDALVGLELVKWRSDMFKITNYKICDNDGVKTVIVTFADGAKTHAVCCKNDVFDLSRGIEVCILKYVLGDKYKEVIRRASNQVKALDKAAEKARKDAEAEKAALKRKQEKAAKRKAKRLAKQRAARVAEMKEAYLAAMKEYGAICETFADDIK